MHAMNRELHEGSACISCWTKFRRLMPEIGRCAPPLWFGFPGENRRDFARLYQFAEESEFDLLRRRPPYSKEEGTPAYRMKGPCKKGRKEGAITRQFHGNFSRVFSKKKEA